MAVRFFSELQSSEGNVWKVEIHDTDYVGSSASFTLASPGFTLAYTGGQDIFAPLMPSTCTVHMMAQNAAELALITDLADFQEGRFLVRIISDPDGGEVNHWVGMMTAESIAVVDEYYPQAIDMRSICGLATLATVEFDADTFSPTTTTALGRVLQSLAQIPTRDIYDASEVYLSVGPDVEPNTGDEFIDAIIISSATYSETAANVEIGSCENMLTQIMSLLNSRLAMVGGRWLIMPVSRMMDISTALPGVLNYRKGGVLLTAASDAVGFTVSQTGNNYRLAGWETSYLPAVRRVSRALNYFGNHAYMWQGLTLINPIGATDAPYSSGVAFDAGATLATTDHLTVSCYVSIFQGHVVQTGDAMACRYRLELTVRVGTKYLKRFTPFDYSTTDNVVSTADVFNPGNAPEAQWTTDSADRYTVFTDPIIVTSTYTSTNSSSLQISFDTPEIGTAEDSDIEITCAIRGYHGVASSGQPSAYVNSTAVLDAASAHINSWCYVRSTGGSGGDVLTFGATIALGATEEIEILPSSYGEVSGSNLFNVYNPGALQISGGNPSGFTSTGTTVAAPINELLCLDRLRHFAKQRQIFSGGAIFGDLFTPYKRVEINSSYYLVTQMSFAAENDSYDLELELVEALNTSVPGPQSVVRTSVLPEHTADGAANDVTEATTTRLLQNTGEIAAVAAAATAARTAMLLSNLADVSTHAPSNDQVLTYSTSGGEWLPATPSGGGGGITVNTQADNRVITATAVTDTLQGESGLTYDGTDFTVSGMAIVSAVQIGTAGLSSDGDYSTGAELITGYTGSAIAGNCMYLRSTGSFALAGASTLGTHSTGFFVIGVSSNAADGVISRGIVYMNVDPGGAIGDVVYLSTSSGDLSTTAPTATGNVSRIVGYKLGTNVIYFNPSQDWIVLA